MAYHHQHYNTPSYYEAENKNTIQIPWQAIAATSVVLCLLIHRVLVAFKVPGLSFRELCWNTFVYLMPSKVVLGLGTHTGALKLNQDQSEERPSTHAAKSDVLRSVFKLGSGPTTPGKPTTNLQSTIPPGLGNWDNSCYQNSVLQALASLPRLEAFFNEVESCSDNITDDSTFAALEVLLRNLNNGKNCGSYLWTPAKLKSMSSWQQQDAQEYFSKIMDSMEKDVAVAVKPIIATESGCDLSSITSIMDGIKQDGTVFQEGNSIGQIPTSERKSKPEGKANLANPVEGLLAQRVGCTRCGYVEGFSLIPFNCITLPLGRENTYDIRDCLDEYTNLEDIEGVECAKCTLLKAKQQAENGLRSKSTTNGSGAQTCAQSGESAEYPEVLRLQSQLDAIRIALDNGDFAEMTLSNKCNISSKQRVSSTKTRQAIILKAPPCLVLHTNRSLFDEFTGMQVKNYADVNFSETLDLGPWCLGKTSLGHDENNDIENWETNPNRSMLEPEGGPARPFNYLYRLRAVITHQGRHENGHYICYRIIRRTHDGLDELANDSDIDEADPVHDEEEWWRLSDETVSKMRIEDVVQQGGAFMLFYERVERFDSGYTAAEAPVQISDSIQKAISEDETNESDGSEDTLTTTSLSLDEPSMPPTPGAELGTPISPIPGKEQPTLVQQHQSESPPSHLNSLSRQATHDLLRSNQMASALPSKMRTSNLYHADDSEEHERSLLASPHVVV